MEPLPAGDTIRDLLRTQRIGRQIEVHASLDSTNARAAALANEGAHEGLVVIAEEQTAGRGRLGRRWHAPARSALLFSVVLRPPLQLTQAQRVTMLCAVAACRAIERSTGLSVGIKWPNDLVISGRKVGGILTELRAQGGQLAVAVVGLGLNVNTDVSVLPEVITPATSLAAERGTPVDRLGLLLAILQEMDALYSRLCEGWSPIEEWRERLATLGQAVRATSAEETVEGTAVDVDADGALLVQQGDGTIRRVLVGDVTLRS